MHPRRPCWWVSYDGNNCSHGQAALETPGNPTVEVSHVSVSSDSSAKTPHWSTQMRQYLWGGVVYPKKTRQEPDKKHSQTNGHDPACAHCWKKSTVYVSSQNTKFTYEGITAHNSPLEPTFLSSDHVTQFDHVTQLSFFRGEVRVWV